MKVDAKAFKRDVLDVVSQIPSGRVLTYGLVASLAGYPHHARLVGRVMQGTSAAQGVPCHRVVYSTGRTAPCWPEQQLLLAAEGVALKPNGCVDLKRHLWNCFDSNQL